MKGVDFMINCYEIRKALGLTQDEMAKKIGVSTRAIQNYEAGRIPKSRIFEAYKKLQEDVIFDGKTIAMENMNNYEIKLAKAEKRIKELEEEVQRLKITIKCLTELL